jgi:C4-dicarboxylate-specific signal transduction histidine kinase
MREIWKSSLWRAVLISLVGGAVLILLARVLFALGLDTAAAGFLLLVLISLLSLVAGFFESVFLSMVAAGSLNYYFIPPIFSFQVAGTDDTVAMIAFTITSVIITGLAARVRRVAAEELRQTRADLARFARVAVLGELTASIAHEVNQPLSGVVSSGNACLRWLGSDPPNVEKAMQSATRIIRDANRASEVVQRVRALVTNAPPEKTWVSLNEAIEEIIILSRSDADTHRIQLRTSLADNLPPVWADKIQVQQVLLNLMTNAVDALRSVEGGTRDLTISTAAEPPSGVIASVRDTGPGVDPAKLEHVFDAFYTTKSEGMGMGLAISKSIIEAHGGRLWATANQPRGASFQFVLPTTEGEPA